MSTSPIQALLDLSTDDIVRRTAFCLLLHKKDAKTLVCALCFSHRTADSDFKLQREEIPL